MDEMLVHEDVLPCATWLQNAILMAARMMDSAGGGAHPIIGGNASCYAAKAARTGRRSY